MNILLLGSGGREHALAWKLSQSPSCGRLFIAPGNAGTAQCGTNMPFSYNDFDAVLDCCVRERISMVVVGPEEPLVKGIVDFLKKELPELMVIGPDAEAAQLEGSKAFAKEFMQRHGIPTAAYREFNADNYHEGIEYLQKLPLPIVLKADGLAAGKGVIICRHHVEAVSEFELMIQRAKFGEAGKRVVVEEFLSGIELSVFVLTDGRHYLLLPEAKDYKRAGEGDTGLNTGGMGAVSPVPFADEAFMARVRQRIIEPTIKGIQKELPGYRGFVFFGLIKVADDPFVIEYNCRLGDPETEVIIPRLRNDLVELLRAAAKKELGSLVPDIDPRHATTIVAVSGGYPGDYRKGLPVEISDMPGGTLLFHAGTRQENGGIVTNGGRVICATALAANLKEALRLSGNLVEQVHFEDKYYRRDIGYEFTGTPQD